MNIYHLLSPAIFLKSGMLLTDPVDPTNGFILLGVGILFMIIGMILDSTNRNKKSK